MKNNVKTIVPKLRFKEFEDSWSEKRLNTLADKVVDKNSCLLERILTNSAIDGIIDQKEYFERDIVTTSNISNYFVVDKNDYVYNPRVSANAPVGPISKNHIGKGVMSPLYTVFRFRDLENDFFEHFFNSNHWHKYILDEANTGARFDRISISDAKFLNMPIALPTKREEQKKIADCLTSLDELITAESKKLELLQDHKKGLMQKLFPAEGKTMPEWRFPEFRDCGEWLEQTLSTLISTIVDNRGKTPPVVNEGIPLVEVNSMTSTKVDYSKIKKYVTSATYNTWFRNYLKAGDILFSTVGNTGMCSQYTGEIISVVAQNIIGLRFKDEYLNTFMLYLMSENNNNKYIKSIEMSAVQPSIKVTQLTKLKFLLPKDKKEQQKIADCLSSIDSLILEQSNKIEQFKEHKKGLMQGLFPSLEEVE